MHLTYLTIVWRRLWKRKELWKHLWFCSLFLDSWLILPSLVSFYPIFQNSWGCKFHNFIWWLFSVFNHSYLSRFPESLSIKLNKSLSVIQIYFHVKMASNFQKIFPSTSPHSEKKKSISLLYLWSILSNPEVFFPLGFYFPTLKSFYRGKKTVKSSKTYDKSEREK